MNTNDLEDLELIRSFQNGDQTAFQTLFQKYGKKVIAIFVNRQIPEDDALDLCQELFIHLYQKLPEITIQTSFSTLLYSAIRHKIIDYSRKQKKFRLLFQMGFDEFLTDDQKKIDSDDKKLCSKFPDESYFDFIDAVEHCLKRLGNPRWQAMVSLWLEGCTHEQIAVILDMPIGSVSSGLSRCFQLFINCMKKHYFNSEE